MGTISSLIALNLKATFHGGNWTSVNFKVTLSEISWQEAVAEVPNFNTIAKLTTHLGYYFTPISSVLAGNPLVARDADSFLVPSIRCEADWTGLVERLMMTADRLAADIEQLDDSRLAEPFAGGDYGTVFRNLTGVIEHSHYHLGQIVLLKKLMRRSVINMSGH
ncbi:MAG: hypothetical protein RL021_1325 [Bacteroidota bacterium]